jgi:hypothetical protein
VNDQPPSVTKHITFTLEPSGEWNIQLWPPGCQPVAGKVYRLRIVVPAELVGQTIEATIET